MNMYEMQMLMIWDMNACLTTQRCYTDLAKTLSPKTTPKTDLWGQF
jgi:hypothetical protein